MPKLKTIYICQKCAQEHSKWSGQCQACKEWNSLIEDVVSAEEHKKAAAISASPITPDIVDFDNIDDNRIQSGIEEFDRVLGGGILQDAIMLISGDPGIGKSTLILQVVAMIAAQNKKVFYFSGEESVDQIAKRILRLKLPTDNLQVLQAFQLEEILATIKEYKPECVVVDSVQVMMSMATTGNAGSINQVRAVTEEMMKVAKKQRIPVFLIGHVTKDGSLAGPMALSHLVDTVLYLEGEKYQHLRLLRSLKNRFGNTQEVGVFAMEEEGMVEVKNPSAAFLEGRDSNAYGSAVGVTLEGTRPFLLEIQALTTSTVFGYPKRTASGIDNSRLHLMIAVLNKYTKMKLDSQDVYVNVMGGFKVSDPACDLAMCMAIASSKLKVALPPETVIIGEVALSGEIRPVSQLERRLNDVEKLGFKQAIITKSKKTKSPKNLKLMQVTNMAEAIGLIR